METFLVIAREWLSWVIQTWCSLDKRATNNADLTAQKLLCLFLSVTVLAHVFRINHNCVS